MGDGDFRGSGRGTRAHPQNDQQAARDGSGSGRERKRRQPAPPRRKRRGFGRRRGRRLLRQEDDAAAVRALCEVREALLAFLLRQRAFDEGAEPIGVEMRSGMASLAHD